MESIRILQDTYEKLYALSAPVVDFLETNLPRISNTWKRKCVDEIFEMKVLDRELTEFDIYYLLKILLHEKNWNKLKNLDSNDDFYTEYNKELLSEVKKIRNEIAHPRIGGYDEDDLKNWNAKIERAANLFGKEINDLVIGLHKTEKDRLLSFIREHTFDITMKPSNFEKLSPKVQESIKRTRERLESQNTAGAIMALIEENYFLEKGKFIYDELVSHSLPTFEDMMDDLRKFYYFGK